VLLKTSPSTHEIVIWDNASTDGTADYLATLTDRRIRVVRSEENIGQSAYARAFRLTSSPYMIEIDDDVTDAPPEWDRTLLDAFKRLPGIGFLAADLVDDPNDEASQYRHHIRPHEYTPVEESGVHLLVGPTGGGCAITSRELSERVGGFSENPKEIFWLEDEKYIADLERIGFRAAVLADLRVHHTGGSYYSTISSDKAAYWKRRFARQARRDAVKRLLVRVPFVRRLNERYSWFVAPS
jgi:GT2 family glycosyltransferase